MKISVLKCEQCGGKIEAQSFDVVVCCTNCATAFEVKPDRLIKRELIYLVNTTIENAVYLPFWLIPASVDILYSDSGGVSFSGILNFFGEALGIRSKSQEKIDEFILPSFLTGLNDMRKIALNYTLELPRKFTKTNHKVLGARLSFEDAKNFAEFILVSFEVSKPGVLQKFKYKIEFGEPRILGVPFSFEGNFFIDIFGDKYKYSPTA